MKSEMVFIEYHTTSPVDVQFKVIDNTPGLAVKTENTVVDSNSYQDKSQTEKVTFKLADFQTKVHACISIYFYA